jgi:hypothetical protein
LHTTGVLGRLFAEAIENAPPGPGDALRVQGVPNGRVFLYATLPQVLPQLMSYTLYRWENNIRAAAVLGVVGAGGLGQLLAFHMGLFQMGKTATLIGAMLLMVAMVDASNLAQAAHALKPGPQQFEETHRMTPQPAHPTPANPACQQMAQRYVQVRAQTESLAAPLSEADCQVQSMPDASPTKWHLAHVTWFFETFVLERFEPGTSRFDPAFRVLFNSYYQAVGAQHPRPQRGLITRPDLAEVRAYRAQVDAAWSAAAGNAAADLPCDELPTLWNWACSTSSNTRSCCSPTSSTCWRATR